MDQENTLFNYSTDQAPPPNFEQFVKLFTGHLTDDGLVSEQIEEHHNNLDFYFEHFVAKKAPLNIDYGAEPSVVSEFIGDFLVHKAMWTGTEDQKSMIASIVDFYSWLAEQNRIPRHVLDALHQTIELDQDSWYLAMDRYSDEALELWQSEGEIEFDEEFEEAFRAEIEDDVIDVPDDLNFDELEIPSVDNSCDTELDDHHLEELESLTDDQ